MDLLYSVFFGAGVAALAYSQLGRRVGFSNTSSISIIVVITFLIATFVAYSLMAWVFNFH